MAQHEKKPGIFGAQIAERVNKIPAKLKANPFLLTFGILVFTDGKTAIIKEHKGSMDMVLLAMEDSFEQMPGGGIISATIFQMDETPKKRVYQESFLGHKKATIKDLFPDKEQQERSNHWFEPDVLPELDLEQEPEPQAEPVPEPEPEPEPQTEPEPKTEPKKRKRVIKKK